MTEKKQTETTAAAKKTEPKKPETKKKATPPLHPKIEKEYVRIRYEFSPIELAAIGGRVAELAEKVEILTREKKSAVRDYDSQIERVELEAGDCMRALRDKFETRKVDAFRVLSREDQTAYYFKGANMDNCLSTLKQLKTASAMVEYADDESTSIDIVKRRPLSDLEQRQTQLPEK